MGEKSLDHRKFSVTLQPAQLYEAVKKCIHNDEINNDRLLTLFRITADALHRNDEFNNVLMWNHIKVRTEAYYSKRKTRYNKR